MFGSWITRLGVLAGHPAAILIVAIYAAAWWWNSPSTVDWHAGATIATWLMTVLIQRATHRDTQALHAKIDELLHSSVNARSVLSGLDRWEPEEIEKHRLDAQQKASDG